MSQKSTTTDQQELLSKGDVKDRYRIQIRTLGKWAVDPQNKFPKPLKLSPRMVRYRRTDIENYLSSLQTA